MVGVNISMLFVTASLIVSTGGILGVALQSLISSAITIVQDFSMRILGNDAGCTQ